MEPHSTDAGAVEHTGLTPAEVDAAASAFSELAVDRLPGGVVVRVETLRRGTDGWASTHTAVDVVVDDLTFIADSVTAHLARRGFEVHRLVEATQGAHALLHVEIDRESDVGVLARLRVEIEDVVADVRAAVTGWPAMRDQALRLAAALRDDPPPGLARSDTTEAAAFLEWLADDHFTFIGACDYELEGHGDDTVLRPVAGSELGVARRGLPGDPGGRGPGLRAPFVLTLTKATDRSTVHRAVPLDDLRVRRFDDDGSAIGEYRFLGLYTSTVYTDTMTRIPVLRHKVAAVLAGARPGHEERILLNVLETLPRDELFRLPVDQLAALADGVAGVGERRVVRLFVTRDEFDRFVSCLVYLPRDRYTTHVRTSILDALQRAFGATASDFAILVGDSVMARLHVVLHARPPGTLAVVEESVLEAQLAAIARAWSDELRDRIQAVRGEEAGLDTFRSWAHAFPPGYQADVSAAEAVADLEVLERLGPAGDLAIRLAHGADADGDARLKLYRSGEPLMLSDVMPLLAQLDVVVVDERPYEIIAPAAPPGSRSEELGRPSWIYSFGVHAVSGVTLDDPQLQTRVVELFLGVWSGSIENDGLNRLVIAAGLSPRDVVVVRALTKYLHQAGVRFTEAGLATTLVTNPTVTRTIVELFHARLAPDTTTDARRIEEELGAQIDAVVSLDDDRLLRALTAVVRATVRTNAYLPDLVVGDRLAIKLDPTLLEFLPRPRPEHEIWVSSPRVEGVHLRGGDIARGGIRWSDRRDDFRTEVLGLMKAQTAKNSVIVPDGAKGGFVVKRPRADVADLGSEMLECYQSFIRGLLDLTDNVVDGVVVAPKGVVRHDGDDPYLVVAADKGTAAFSDVANALADEYGYWLGDAFASGGSRGYDHKEMGITARGAWISVRAHFRALGVDADSTELTTVGIGDMSGDVFGNGMLRSPHLRLIAAFDHRHLFLDPDPDPATSFRERRRLYELPGSSWADYDPALVSAGGGVYARTEKSVALSAEARRALGVTSDAPLTPDEVASAILRADVDLLWNGGIGTFVKASTESNADVGDRANDAVRIDATELRCTVVAEGGNLGLTQTARIEYALGGGRVFTDAIDNSAGVNCSDHEVNVKILLRDAIGAGDLDDAERDPLLVEMTDEVAALVLADNEAQVNALQIAILEASDLVGVHARQIDRLERAGIIDRTLERLPDSKALQERIAAGRGLTTPELAVLLAFTKLELQRQLVQSDLPDDDYFDRELVAYFPTQLRERFADLAATHPLRRELVATVVANAVVNRAGITFLSRLADETGLPIHALARAHVVARDVFDVTPLWSAIDVLDLVVPAATQDRMFLALRRLVERAARWFARHGDDLEIGATLTKYRPAVAEVLVQLPELVRGTAAESLRATAAQLVTEGVPEPLALQIAGAEAALEALTVAELAAERGAPVDHVAGISFTLSDRLHLDWLRERVAALPRSDRWQTEARAALRDDLSDCHRELTASVLAAGPTGEATAVVDEWVATHHEAVVRYERVLDEIRAGGVYDLAQLTAARRALRDLSEIG